MLKTLYAFITGFSITGIPVIDFLLSIVFNGIAFAIAWKIGGLFIFGYGSSVAHWISRIGVYTGLVILTHNIF